MVRVYRQSDLLGFYYDQGRDALKVADILTFRDLPAIGPTTGLSGIFLGPFWFYFLAPFYWLARGNPALAASFVGLVDSLTVLLLYFLGKRFFSQKTGFLAAVFWAFSFGLIRSARWFSNPSPLPFFTVILLWGLGEWLINKNQKWLPVVFASLAISSQLEAASAVFYFPAILILVWQFRVRLKDLFRNRWFWTGVAIFALSLVPQIGFELKNNFLMTRNLLGFFTGRVNTDTGQSWAMPTREIIKERLSWYYRAFFNNLDPNLKLTFWSFLFWFVGLLFYFVKRRSQFLRLLLIFWLTPLVFLFFFVGNYGNLYDYYLTGFFPAFILLSAYFLTSLPNMAVLFFLVYFLWQNGGLIKGYLTAGVDGPENITLGNQKQAVEWVCQDRKEARFNVDVYVPPVIPYAWDYLWQWYGCQELDCCPSRSQEGLLYTIWEVDPPHPERLNAWLERQSRIGKIKKRVRFGGIGIERRERLP